MSGFSAELKQVSVSLGGRRILDGFGLSILRGEWVVVSGPSGSGKSVLARILALRASPDHGEVRLLGEVAPRVGSRAARLILRTRLGYLPQHPRAANGGILADTLWAARVRLPGSRIDHARAIRHALDGVGLSGIQDRPWRDLSVGERQRVALAHAVVTPCELLVVDEPLSTLDPANAEAALRLLEGLHQRGTTIVMITGNPDAGARFARRVDLLGRPSARW